LQGLFFWANDVALHRCTGSYVGQLCNADVHMTCNSMDFTSPDCLKIFSPTNPYVSFDDLDLIRCCISKEMMSLLSIDLLGLKKCTIENDAPSLWKSVHNSSWIKIFNKQ
jgi:hypothetical protein